VFVFDDCRGCSCDSGCGYKKEEVVLRFKLSVALMLQLVGLSFLAGAVVGYFLVPRDFQLVTKNEIYQKTQALQVLVDYDESFEELSGRRSLTTSAPMLPRSIFPGRALSKGKKLVTFVLFRFTREVELESVIG